VTRVSIAAQPAAIFEYLTDLKRHYLWNPQLQNISSTEALRLGSVYQTSSMVLGVKIASTNTVTRFSPLRELEIENNTGTVHYRAHFRLQPDGERTSIICSTTVSSKSGAFAFTAPILRRLARRELQTDMQALKIAVEHGLE
jgi:hypothetical protein